MFLGISKKLQTLLAGVMANSDIYLVIYSDTNWAILDYWGGNASYSFNPKEESDGLHQHIALIVNAGRV